MALLPLIHRKHIKRDGKVDLWDIVEDGGPVKIEFPAILAREALARDPERYHLNLPRGLKPGPLQAENEERIRLQNEEAEATADADPVYGGRRKAE